MNTVSTFRLDDGMIIPLLNAQVTRNGRYIDTSHLRPVERSFFDWLFWRPERTKTVRSEIPIYSYEVEAAAVEDLPPGQEGIFAGEYEDKPIEFRAFVTEFNRMGKMFLKITLQSTGEVK